MEPIYAMVIAPHPDDAEIGAGGLIARWIIEGNEVVYVVCTYGEKGTCDPTLSSEDLKKIRKEEQKAAAKILGVKEVLFLGLPDQELEDTPEFRKEIVRLIRHYRPQVVVTTDPYRQYIWHRDHRICGQVVLDAVFPFARDRLAYPELLVEGLQPHKVKEILCTGPAQSNYEENITSTIDLKMKSMRCYISQVGTQNTDESIEELLKIYGNNDDKSKAIEYFYRVETPK